MMGPEPKFCSGACRQKAHREKSTKAEMSAMSTLDELESFRIRLRSVKDAFIADGVSEQHAADLAAQLIASALKHNEVSR